MLPETWKKEIGNSIEQAAQRQAENRKREVYEHDAAIAAPLNSLRDQFDSYKEQQNRSEEGKRRREIATIVGLFLTAALALGRGVVLILQWRALSSTDEKPPAILPPHLSNRLPRPKNKLPPCKASWMK